MSYRRHTIDLKTQLEMYARGDIDELEDLMTPSNLSKVSSSLNKSIISEEPIDDDLECFTDYNEEDHRKDQKENEGIRKESLTREESTTDSSALDNQKKETKNEGSILNEESEYFSQKHNIEVPEKKKAPIKQDRRGPLKQASNIPPPVSISSAAEQVKEAPRDRRTGKKKTHDANGYPILTDKIKKEITDLTKSYVKTKEYLKEMNRQKNELNSKQRDREHRLLQYIHRYGLRDITMGRHQLVPQAVKGRKRSFNRKKIEENLIVFLTKMDITDEAEELALQATEFLDSVREIGDDSITLKHNIL